MTKTIFILLPFLALTSCSQLQKKEVKKGPKVYDQDVEDEFSSIENGTATRQEVLEYYRRLRQEDWNKYKKGSTSGYNWRRKKRHQKVVPKRYQKPRSGQARIAPLPRRTPKPLSANIVKEMRIEISQYMSYYCMQNRKSSRFSGSADCSAYTENILRECEGKFPIISDRSLVKCVQARLK